MIKVALSCNEDYSVFVATNLETPYQVLSARHINPDLRKVFINGSALTQEKYNTPLNRFGEPGVTVHIVVKF